MLCLRTQRVVILWSQLHRVLKDKTSSHLVTHRLYSIAVRSSATLVLPFGRKRDRVCGIIECYSQAIWCDFTENRNRFMWCVLGNKYPKGCGSRLRFWHVSIKSFQAAMDSRDE